MSPPHAQDRNSEDRRPGAKLPIPARVALMGLAAGLTIVLATAGILRPDPRGFGTHEQLGRPPCPILRLTGRPCPSCGMTTAFAWFVRGDLAQSWRANPAGLLVACLCVPTIPWLLAASATGRPPGVRSAGQALMTWAVVAAIVTVLTWVVRRSLQWI